MKQILLSNGLILLGPWFFAWTSLNALVFYWLDPLVGFLIYAYFFLPSGKQGLIYVLGGLISLILSLLSIALAFGPKDTENWFKALFWDSELVWLFPLLLLAQALPIMLLRRQQFIWLLEQVPLALQISLNPKTWLGLPIVLPWLVYWFRDWGLWSILPLVLLKTLWEIYVFMGLKAGVSASS